MGRVVVARRVDHVSAALELLRPVHRGVGVSQERLGVARVLRIQADADRGRDEELAAPQVERLLQRLAHARGHGLGDEQRRHRAAGDRAGPSLEIGEQQQELVAAQARDRVGLTRAHAEALRQLDQQLVAGVVPERVVHELEVVEVQERARRRRGRSDGHGPARSRASPRTTHGSAGRSTCRGRPGTRSAPRRACAA